MRGTHILIVSLTVFMLSIPAASAEWAGRGFYEPDHARDHADGLMFANPDNSDDVDLKQVYFNIYSTFFIAGGNPNSATLGSAIMPYPTSIHAYLGVWKDCNDDGYIGFPESALLEYRSELLLDTSICPADTSAHNDGEWVQEFLWVGPDDAAACGLPEDPAADDDPYNIVDNCARVWADFGLPADAGTASCPVNPRPRGTYQSTGGALRFVDCIAGWRGTGAVNTVAHASGNDDLAFDDAQKERPDQSASPLNQKNPYGQQGDDTMVQAFDCSSTTDVSDPTAPGPGQSGMLRRIAVADPTGGDLSGPQNIVIGTLTIFNGTTHETGVNGTGDDGIITSFGTPVVPSVNPSGSPAGTVNKTIQGLDECDDSEDGLGTLSDIYSLDEDDFSATGAVRTATDFYFNFRETTSRGDDNLGEATGPLLGLGIWTGEGQPLVALTTPLWFGAPGYVASRNPYVNRDTLLPWGSVTITGFASVSAEAIASKGLSVPAGPATFVYGAEHCGDTPSGAWNCDRTAWWEGQAVSDWYARPGDTYNMRDIDCWDATPARGTPSATAATNGNECAR